MAQGVTGGVARMGRSHRGGSVPPETFVIEAERLLELSRTDLVREERLTWAYRAALRGAGAVIQFARKKRRRLPPGSAWEKVRALAGDEEMEAWCRRFAPHARLVAQVEMGLVPDLSEERVTEVYQDACLFLDAVRGRVGYLPEVA
ncbi:SAV_6107 family HEPN domain-containing protein [Corynebacterium sp.]|uniref:SAV_6107 family HEPN domain-containing protein n=1 Tax=Corynebacterium sp. TaxID=1720 RepID=UPI0025BCC638|nr:SAV_6107 family HEPN domain-containing protein [Corynebacterium sp.]